MIIETQGLKKTYRTDVVETTAVDGVNFTLDEGQFVSIMGPSGCGKSTAANATFCSRIVSVLDGRIVSDKQQSRQ